MASSIVDGIKSMSISSLFGSLHESMLNMVKSVDTLIAENRQISLDDIRTLRDHISNRLKGPEEITEKQKLLKLLDLFSTDKAVIELMKDEAEEWLEMLESVESNITNQTRELTDQEKAEVEKIGKLVYDIKEMIRK